MFGEFFVDNSAVGDIRGVYNLKLVALSYLIAFFASFVALDIAKNIKPDDQSLFVKRGGLICGAFALGAGIWTMHFIGMLAFSMPMPMQYDPTLTGLSMLCAIVASGFAFYLLMHRKAHLSALLGGGILIGLGIAAMHYVGMAAMQNMVIRYHIWPFMLSIGIAILASQAALGFMIKSTATNPRYRVILNLSSAALMAAAICGMHYTGMFAAVFYSTSHEMKIDTMDPELLSFYIAIMTFLIMGIGLIVSTYKQVIIAIQEKKNQELSMKENKLSELNQELRLLALELADKEQKTYAILSTAAEAIMTVDPQGKIETSNPAAEKMFDYQPGELVGKSIQNHILQKNLDPLSIQKLLSHKGKLEELVGRTSKGETFYCELSLSKMSLMQGDLYELVLRNIDDRIQTEQRFEELNKQLIGTARRAGMAEVASSVLHNVGNVLNSLNISAGILKQKLENSEMFGLEHAKKFIEQHRDSLLAQDAKPQSIEFLDYICLLGTEWAKEYSTLSEELNSLINKIEHIKHVVGAQQSLGTNSGLLEEVSLEQVCRDALLMNNLYLNSAGLKVKTEFLEMPNLILDKTKLLQILVNLIRNSIESLVESGNVNKFLSLKTGINAEGKVEIQIQDNGVGISSENLEKVFHFGFTTKKKGHGFGLHACAICAKEMGGTLKATSDGPEMGAVFTLEFPYQTPILQN